MKKRRHANIKINSSKVVVEVNFIHILSKWPNILTSIQVPHIGSLLDGLNRRFPGGHDSDSEGSIDYDTWMGVKKTIVTDTIPLELELDELKQEITVEEGLQLKLKERLMYRPESSKHPRQRASRFPRLWNFSVRSTGFGSQSTWLTESFQDVKTFNQQNRRPNELEVPFTAPSGRTAHIWNPKRRVAFHSSLNIPSLHVVGRYTKTSGSTSIDSKVSIS